MYNKLMNTLNIQAHAAMWPTIKTSLETIPTYYKKPTENNWQASITYPPAAQQAEAGQN